MKKYKGLLITSIILIVIGLIGIMCLGLFTGSFSKGSCGGFNRFNQSMLSDIDRHFIEQMIPHHEDAIEMSELALKKAEHEELKTLSENIIHTQSKEIADMITWYKSWYGAEVPESANFEMGMMDDMTDLKALEGADIFDKEFIEQMIPHHQMAVMMASMMLNRTDRAEMKKLAQDIIRTQTEEINQMNTWYSKWY